MVSRKTISGRVANWNWKERRNGLGVVVFTVEAGYTDTKGQKHLCKCLYYPDVGA